MNRTNLLRLATYLSALPADYDRFDMHDFMRNTSASDDVVSYALDNHGLPGCATVACAVGHGPAAGIFLIREELSGSYETYGNTRVDWSGYCDRVFGVTTADVEFEWMFGGSWAFYDNTPQGAAKRIRYLLQHSVPEFFESAFDDRYLVSSLYQDSVALYQDC